MGFSPGNSLKVLICGWDEGEGKKRLVNAGIFQEENIHLFRYPIFSVINRDDLGTVRGRKSHTWVYTHNLKDSVYDVVIVSDISFLKVLTGAGLSVSPGFRLIQVNRDSTPKFISLR